MGSHFFIFRLAILLYLGSMFFSCTIFLVYYNFLIYLKPGSLLTFDYLRGIWEAGDVHATLYIWRSEGNLRWMLVLGWHSVSSSQLHKLSPKIIPSHSPISQLEHWVYRHVLLHLFSVDSKDSSSGPYACDTELWSHWASIPLSCDPSPCSEIFLDPFGLRHS